MKYGVVMRTDIDLRTVAELARETEEAGWDGYFIWDIFYMPSTAVLLAAIAMRTERLRFGAMLTPPSRRRPWQLAGEAATLDHLSNGRLVLPIGLGAAEDMGFATVGEATDRKVRAELLDEGIDILDGLWRGEPFSYEGKHYQLRDAILQPPPVQKPRIPIWVVGAWPSRKSMRRVARCDGLLPSKITPDGISADMTPEEIRAMKAFIDEHRTLTTPFDIIMEGETSGNDPERAAAVVRRWAEAGATWWLESVWARPYNEGGLDDVRRRIQQGPPSSN